MNSTKTVEEHKFTVYGILRLDLENTCPRELITDPYMPIPKTVSIRNEAYVSDAVVDYLKGEAEKIGNYDEIVRFVHTVLRPLEIKVSVIEIYLIRLLIDRATAEFEAVESVYPTFHTLTGSVVMCCWKVTSSIGVVYISNSCHHKYFFKPETGRKEVWKTFNGRTRMVGYRSEKIDEIARHILARENPKPLPSEETMALAKDILSRHKISPESLLPEVKESEPCIIENCVCNQTPLLNEADDDIISIPIRMKDGSVKSARFTMI